MRSMGREYRLYRIRQGCACVSGTSGSLSFVEISCLDRPVPKPAGRKEGDEAVQREDHFASIGIPSIQCKRDIQ